MSEYKDVVIYGEVTEGKLSFITTELLGCGRKLANDLGQGLCAVLVGSGVSNLAQEAIAFGADKVYVVDSPMLEDYQTDSYVAVLERVVKQVVPRVLLLGKTSIGIDLAPRLAFRLGTIATADCVALEIDPESKRLLRTKPVYGGNALAVYTSDSDPQIATVRAKVMSPLERDSSRKGEVIPIEADILVSTIRTRVLEKVKEAVEGVKLEDAPVVVGGGRGIGGADGFKQLAELAKLLKGAVGSSRPASDNAWVADTTQIGLTGRTVSPELYIAVGISGSSQHLAGCSGAKNIVAINRDPEANIFKVARYGVVGDWKKVIPAFTQKLRELLAQ